jgi:hypothetical protein
MNDLHRHYVCWPSSAGKSAPTTLAIKRGQARAYDIKRGQARAYDIERGQARAYDTLHQRSARCGRRRGLGRAPSLAPRLRPSGAGMPAPTKMIDER